MDKHYRGRQAQIANYTVWPEGRTTWNGRKIIVCPHCGKHGAYIPLLRIIRRNGYTHILRPFVLHRYQWGTYAQTRDACTLRDSEVPALTERIVQTAVPKEPTR